MCDTTLPDLHDDDEDEAETHNHGAAFTHQLGENVPVLSEMNRWKDDDPPELQQIFTFRVRFHQQELRKSWRGGVWGGVTTGGAGRV